MTVNEPSLNDGRNERPRVKNTATAATNSTQVTVSTMRVWARLQASARVYAARSLRLSQGSRERVALSLLRRLSR